MICPDCKNDIMDGAKACPYCGASFLTRNTPTTPMSIQKQAAQKELNSIDTDNIKLSLFLCIVGIGMLIFSIFVKGSPIHFFIIGILLTVICGGEYIALKEKKERLERILDDKKRKAICPYCKSPNIKQRFVKGSTTREKSRTRVSKNINPLHPFSYRNYDTKPVNTSHNYKTTYYCQTCGSVFDNPQIFEYQ